VEELREKQERFDAERRVQQLEAQLQQAETRVEQSQAATTFCSSMIQEGLIRANETGALVIISQEERENYRHIQPNSPNH
jgi:hypothetical protein